MSMKIRARASGSRCTAVALAVWTLAAAAQTQTAMDRVEITGSIIRRISDETALPVKTITSDEIQSRGHVELKDFLLEMPESSTIGFYAGTVGTLINLRGLGQARSLTLMNGRRFANEPLTDQYVSANTVTKIALSRVETLADGASSIYGSDAIGGVQNYITHKTYQGVTLKADMMEPKRSGGGGTWGLGAMAGFGDISTQGWNLFGAIETSERKVLYRRDRPELSGLDANGLPNTSLSADAIAMGMAADTDLSANQSWPANFLVARNPTTLIPSGTVYNPYATIGCAPPISVRSSSTALTCSANQRNLTLTYGNGTELTNLFTRGTLAIGADHQLSLELNHSENIIYQYSNVVGITNGSYYLSLPKTSQWYPGGTGGVPAVVNGTTTIANATVATTPDTLFLRWLPVDAGLPILRDEHLNSRAVLALEGVLAGWDYRSGLSFGRAERNTMRSKVYTSADLQAGLNSGTLNPFGAQDAAGLAFLESRQIGNQIRRKVQTRKTTFDFTVSKDLFKLPGGMAVLGLGTELRRDEWIATGFAENRLVTVPGAVFGTNNNAGNVNAGKVPTIWMEANPNSNQPDDSMSGKASRTVMSLYGELDMPLTKQLNVNVAVRGDKYKYSHQTIDSINPKVGVRWAPNKMFMLRGSANSGFRAPALPEVFGNADEFRTVNDFDDPLYCNSTTNTSNNPALADTDVCNIALIEVPKSRSAGTTLKPEKSTAYAFGFGFQATRDLGVTADYWSTEVKDVLGTVSLNSLVANYPTYTAQFIRDANGKLLRVMNAKANAGDMRASGVDVGLSFNQAAGDAGTFTASMDISYTLRFESRLVGSSEWISALATSEPLGITTQDGLTGNRATMHRWKHTAAIGWKRGAWSATLSQRYQSKLLDRNEPARVNAAGSVGVRDVAPYSQYGLVVNYNGLKNLKLTAGINNLFDVKPPLTNNSRYQAYQTQIADVLGRSYRLGAEYKF